MTDREMSIYTEAIQNDGKDTYHYHRYEPTPYAVLDELFSYLPPSPHDVLVDYGCGMGRLNFYAEKLYSLKSTGVEFSSYYYKKACENLKNYNGKRDNIHFVCCRAEDYIVSPDETLFYFFNPFSPEIFRSVINHILDSWQNVPRRVTLILYYPEDEAIRYLEQHTAFNRFDEIAASAAISSDRRERLCLYRLEA